MLALPGGAGAHGVEGEVEIAAPLGLYLAAGGATVLLSFALFSVFLRTPGASQAFDYPRLNLLAEPWFAVLAGRGRAALRVLGAFLFALTLAAGLFGTQSNAFNIAPVMIWAIWWVGLSAASAAVGNVWRLLNPWRTLFEWADGLARRGGGPGLERVERYPERWGSWPAVAVLLAFAWVEVVQSGGTSPRGLAGLAVLYSAVTWYGMARFGAETWLARGEAFSLFFGVLARLSPTEVRVVEAPACASCEAGCSPTLGGDCIDCHECFAAAPEESRQLSLRPWIVGLAHPPRLGASGLVFVLLMLATVTFDGLSATPFWAGVQTAAFPALAFLGGYEYQVFQTVGLIATPLVFYAAYLVFSVAIRAFGMLRVPSLAVAERFVLTLVPIALAYQVAHYYTLLLIEGQRVFALLSDPFGWGWNLFGTRDLAANTSFITPEFFWYSQLLLIVAGHVAAVYLGHAVAVRTARTPRLALRAEYPLLVLMILYTVTSLWIVSQPIVREATTSAAAVDRTASEATRARAL